MTTAGPLFPAIGEATLTSAAALYVGAGLPVVGLHARLPDGACTCAEGAACKQPGEHPTATFGADKMRAFRFFKNHPRATFALALGSAQGSSMRLLALVIEGDAGRELLAACGAPTTATARTDDGAELLAFLAPPGLDLAALAPHPGLSVRVEGALPLSGPRRWTWTRRGPVAALPEALARLLSTPAQPGEGEASPEAATATSEAPDATPQAPGPEASPPAPSSAPSTPTAPPPAPAPVEASTTPPDEAPSSSNAPASTPPAPAPSTPPSLPPVLAFEPPASSSAPSTPTATAPTGPEAPTPTAASSSAPSTPAAARSSDPVEPPAAPPAAAGEAPQAPASVEAPSSSPRSTPEASPAPAPAAPLLPVLAHDKVEGWHGNPNAPRIDYLTAAEAFTRRHLTDAHFTAYDAHETPWRLTLDTLPALAQRGGWRMVRLAIDVDAPGKSEKPADDAGRKAKRQRVEAWWADEQPKIAALLREHPGAFIYRSRSGGYRIVYLLACPVVILSLDNKEDWRQRYRRELLYLARRWGIVGDPACADIGRIYRLPFVVHEDGPTAPETLGDPAAIGLWAHEPSEAELTDDVTQARSLAVLQPSVWGPVARALDPKRVGQEAPPLDPQDQDEARLQKRAVGYLATMSPSISGAHGGPALFTAAQAMARGFCLGARTATALLLEHFNPRCQPPWSRAEIERACRNAVDRGEKPWGYLRDADGGQAGLKHKPGEQRQRTPHDRPTTRHTTDATMAEQPAHDDHQGDDEQPPPPPVRAPAWPSPGSLVRRMEAAPQKLPVGLAPIDAGWRGGAPAGLPWVIGGAPGAGKTSLATWLAHEWAKRGVPVAYIAGDEPREGVLIRLGQQIGLDRTFLEEGRPVPLGDLAEHLDTLPLMVLDPDDDDGVGVAAVADELRRRWPEGPGVLVVDSLQAMSRRIPDDVADSPRSKVDAVMRECKAAAKRHGLVLVMLSELARSAYRGGPEQTVDLASTKESGGIEYECGALCILRSVEGEKGLVNVTWGKSRPGRVESFALRQNYATASFTVEGAAQRNDHQSQEKAHTALMALVVDLVKRSPGLAGATAVCARLATTNRGQRKQDVLNAVRELLETGVLENRGTKVRPRLFWTGGEPAAGKPDDPPERDNGSHGSHGSQTVPGNRTGEATRVPENRFPPPMGGTDLGTARRNRSEPGEAPQDDGNRSGEASAAPGAPSATTLPAAPTPPTPEPDEAPPESPAPTTSTPPPASIERLRPAPALAPEPGSPPAPLADPTSTAPQPAGGEAPATNDAQPPSGDAPAGDQGGAQPADEPPPGKRWRARL